MEFGNGENGFALIGHMDTVAEGKAEDWSFPPFSAAIKDNLLFGRGAADNKAGIACGLYTLAVLRDLNLLDIEKQKVILAGVVDEESGASSTLGVRYLIDNGFLPVKGAIYTYTSDIVCIGHRGLLRWRSPHTDNLRMPALPNGIIGHLAITRLPVWRIFCLNWKP